MTMSDREKGIAAITLVVLLYGVLGLTARGRLDAWQVKRQEYRRACTTLELEQKLIAQRQEWDKKYAAVQKLMPVFPVEKSVETHWLGVMESAASNNKLNIYQRKPKAEELINDVYELPIECTSWDGSLDALIHFLYDLESAGVMLDIRKMSISPTPTDHARLRGGFTLYCAFMREKPVAGALPTLNKPETSMHKAASVPQPSSTGAPKSLVPPPAPVPAKSKKKSSL